MRLIPDVVDSTPWLQVGQVALYAAEFVDLGHLLRALSQFLFVLM